MTAFWGSIIMFWGFIFSIMGIFCITNMKIANKVMKKTFKKIFFIGSVVSLIIFLSVFINFMPQTIEMFALAIISSCWLIDLLNKEKYKFDPSYNVSKFYLHDIVWSLSMTVMFCWYLAHIFTGDFGAILTVVKMIILMASVVGSAFVSQKLVKSTL